MDMRHLALSPRWILAVLLLPAAGAATEQGPPWLPCETPRIQPQASRIADERLKAIFCEAVDTLRRGTAAWRQPSASLPRVDWSKEDVAYVLDAAARALVAAPPDWHTFRSCLLIGLSGMQHEARWRHLCLSCLEAPRAEKISDDHGSALRDTLLFLGHMDDPEAIKILERAISRAFWGRTPFRGRTVGTDPELAVSTLQSLSVSGIGLSDPDLALPVLRKLAPHFPDKHTVSAPYAEWRFETTAGFKINQLIAECEARKAKENRQ